MSGIQSGSFNASKPQNSKLIEGLWTDGWSSPRWATGSSKRKTALGKPDQGSLSTGIAPCSEYKDVSTVDMRLTRNEFSWTRLISQQTKCGQARQAIVTYKNMREAGVKPSSYTFVAALKACSKLKDMQSVQEIHAHVVESGYESDVIVATMLVDVYAKCGNLVNARGIFEKMPDRDVVSWNAMILGYAQLEEGEVALQLYTRMQTEGVEPDARTFVSALKACGSLVALEEGHKAGGNDWRHQILKQARAIHLELVTRGYESDVFVGTMLVDVYAKCGSLEDARYVFEKIPSRNVVSWTAMIFGYAQMERGEVGLQLYAKMQQEGVEPNDRTFVGVLKACSSLAALAEGSEVDRRFVSIRCLKQVRAIHSQVLKRGFESDSFVGNMLVDAYAKCGSLVDARGVFDRMPHRDVVSWTVMILGYVQMQEGKMGLQLYSQMQQTSLLPTDRTLVGVLKACVSLLELENEGHDRQWCLEQVRAIHSDAVKGGFELDVFVGSMLVDAYAKCGSLVDARCVFERMPRHDVVSWTAMILGYAQLEEGESALQLYSRMQQEGVVPNDRTFVGVLMACGSVAGLEKGKEMHVQLLRMGLEASDMFVASTLIDMYGKCGSMTDAQQVFDALPTKDVVTWNALLTGYAHQGRIRTVFQLLNRMKLAGVQPDGITFVGVLSVCSHVGLVEKGQEYFEAVSGVFGITPTIEHFTCMVDLLGRAGRVDQAMAMVKTMPLQPNGVIWRTLLGACQKWSNVELGRHAFECAVQLDKNDTAAYVLMSNIYSAAHMYKETKEVKAMTGNTPVWKMPGAAWWTNMTGVVHSFLAGDREHPESVQIYAQLKDLSKLWSNVF